MKAGRWIVALGVLLFFGFLAWGSLSRAKVSCEVCLEFGGEMVCRKGAGADEEEALRTAQESTCGGNARGMSESIACRNRTPDRAQCTTS